LSADGKRVLVLHPAPALGAVDIGDIEVGFIAERGDVVRRLVAREFIDVSRFDMVEDGLSWVERGANGVLVQHRGHSAELTLVGRRRATISFDGEVEVSNPITAATPKDEPKAPERCPASVACTWVDANGVFHVVE